MRKVKLYGRLGEIFGKEFDLDVKSVAEAIRALKANFKDFERYMVDSSKKGIRYRVLIDDEDHTCGEDLILNFGNEKSFSIIPVPESQKAEVRTILGVVLMVVGVFTSPYDGGAIFNLGLALTIGGISEMILGRPKLGTGQSIEDEEQKAGFTFNSQSNTVRQGGPVSVGYGETIRGSQLINFYQLSTDYGRQPPNGISVIGYSSPVEDSYDPDDRLIGIGVGNTSPVRFQPTNPHVPLVNIVNATDFEGFLDDIDTEFGISL